MKLNETLQSLMAQSLKPDAIYLNVPKGKNPRTGEEYNIPDYIVEMKDVTVVRCVDVGPLTKLVPALAQETDPSSLVITVDDDKVYPADVLKTLAWYADHDSAQAWGVCGWSFMWYPRPLGVLPVYVPYFVRGGGRHVDVLQACCGNAYRRSFFDLDDLTMSPKQCFTTDDLWISGYLAAQGIRKVLVNHRLDPDDPSWKSADTNKGSRLSSFNTRNHQDIKCIDAVEERFGKPWETSAGYSS